MVDFSTRIVSDDKTGGDQIVVLEAGGHSKVHIPMNSWMELSAVKYAAEQLAQPQDQANKEPGPIVAGAAENGEEQQALPHRR